MVYVLYVVLPTLVDQLKNEIAGLQKHSINIASASVASASLMRSPTHTSQHKTVVSASEGRAHSSRFGDSSVVLEPASQPLASESTSSGMSKFAVRF